MRTKHTGFTLIELVVVITILGILAAFALPRSAALQADARIATMNAALGSMRAAAALARSIQVAQGLGADTDVTMEGSTIGMTNGYPDATAAAIGHAAGFNEADGDPVAGYVTNVVAGSFVVTPDAEHENCAVTYTPPAAAGAAPTFNNAGLTAANCL